MVFRPFKPRSWSRDPTLWDKATPVLRVSLTFHSRDSKVCPSANGRSGLKRDPSVLPLGVSGQSCPRPVLPGPPNLSESNDWGPHPHSSLGTDGKKGTVSGGGEIFVREKPRSYRGPMKVQRGPFGWRRTFGGPVLRRGGPSGTVLESTGGVIRGLECECN